MEGKVGEKLKKNTDYTDLKFIITKILYFVGFKYSFPIVPKNHLDKYIKYQINSKK